MPKLIILCGPSGVGKKTICDKIITNPRYNIVFSVSITTRKPRNGEINGHDYFFVSKNEFISAINSNKLLEWAKYIDNYYGTPNEFINQQFALNKNVFLEIEMQGVLQILPKFNRDKLLTIFIAPPSLKELEKRLINRKTEQIDIIQKRINQAKWELSKKNLFQYVIINDDLSKSRKQLMEILDNEL